LLWRVGEREGVFAAHGGAELGYPGLVDFLVGGFGVFAGVLAVEGGEAVEEQLADVGLGDGVAAMDAFVSDLLEEIAEIAVDGSGGGEILDAVEKFGGEGFVRLRRLGKALAQVVGAERVVIWGDEQTAAMAAGVDVTAVGVRGKLRRHGKSFLLRGLNV
jgi:hypothetical protein